jgi:hypothetical protein
MAKPVSTRTSLRRAIAGELSMPFFQRYDSSLTADSGSTISKVIDADLTQEDDYWKNSWLYISSDTATANVGAVRQVTRFIAADNALLPEYDLPSAASTGTGFELHTVFSPFETHRAINRAIQEGFPAFYDIVTDESMIVEEDKLAYDISDLTYDPWIISAVYIEQGDDVKSGVVTAGAATYITDTNLDTTGIDTDWKVSIYDGTGKGQMRDVKSVATNRVTTSTGASSDAFSPVPDTTSKYKLWDTAEQKTDWYRMTAARFDKPEFPSKMYLTKNPTGAYGMRFRLIYATQPAELSADSDETVVPREYIINRAVEILAASRIASTRADREKYAAMEQMSRIKADTFREKNSFRMPTTIWQESDPNGPRAVNEENPLQWK